MQNRLLAMVSSLTQAAWGPSLHSILKEESMREATRPAGFERWKEDELLITGRAHFVDDVRLLPDRPAPLPKRLIAAAEARGIDLVVLCSHGRTGFTRWVLGSVAHTLVHQSTAPVLVLRGSFFRTGRVPSGDQATTSIKTGMRSGHLHTPTTHTCTV